MRVSTYSKERHAANMRQRWRVTKDKVEELKKAPCSDCGGTFHVAAMQFDHRPDEEKLFNVSRASNRNWAVIEAEIAKCDLVCANCHAVRTFNRA